MRLFLLWHFALVPLIPYSLLSEKVTFILKYTGDLQDERRGASRDREEGLRVVGRVRVILPPQNGHGLEPLNHEWMRR